MKFSQVAHLYVGCKVKRLHTIHELVGIDGDLLIFYTDDGDVFYGDVKNTEWNKPILLPLSAMTEDDINKIASIILDKETTVFDLERVGTDYIMCYWKIEPSINPLFNEVKMGMTINERFEIRHIWNYVSDKGMGTTNEPLYNHHEITNYLLSHHFDLFNLIQSGEAIDATTLTPNPYQP